MMHALNRCDMYILLSIVVNFVFIVQKCYESCSIWIHDQRITQPWIMLLMSTRRVLWEIIWIYINNISLVEVEGI